MSTIDERLTPEGAPDSPEAQKPETAEVSDIRSDVSNNVEAVSLTPDQLKLQILRESGELSPHDLDLNHVWNFAEAGIPLRRPDLGDQALVLSYEQFDMLGAITIVHKSGEEMTIEPASMNDAELIIFPDELAE